MAYYVFYKDLKKNRSAVDLLKLDCFCQDTIRKDKDAENKAKRLRVKRGQENGKKKRAIQ